jgi:hypothetical protein
MRAGRIRGEQIHGPILRSRSFLDHRRQRSEQAVLPQSHRYDESFGTRADIEHLDTKIFQALLAGLAQIARIAASAYGVHAAVARAAALRMNDHVMPAATDRLAD